MSPRFSVNPSDMVRRNAAEPIEVWATHPAARNHGQSREEHVTEVRWREEMAHWHFRKHHECIRQDQRRHLLDDNPASG